MELLYYDRDGRPVSQKQWQHLGSQHDYCRVDYTDGIRHGRRVIVVTYWLGTATGHQPGPPLIFHTFAEIRRPAGPREAYRRSWSWPTLQAARTGHQAIATWLTGVAAWLAGAAAQPPAPPPALITSQRETSPDAAPPQLREGR
jgi:hypothetical protein